MEEGGGTVEEVGSATVGDDVDEHAAEYKSNSTWLTEQLTELCAQWEKVREWLPDDLSPYYPYIAKALTKMIRSRMVWVGLVCALGVVIAWRRREVVASQDSASQESCVEEDAGPKWVTVNIPKDNISFLNYNQGVSSIKVRDILDNKVEVCKILNDNSETVYTISYQKDLVTGTNLEAYTQLNEAIKKASGCESP